MHITRTPLFIALAALALSACSKSEDATTTTAAPVEPAAVEAIEPAPVSAETTADVAAAAISGDSLMTSIGALASDEFGGRAPMSEGERLTLDFLEAEFKALGLEPMFGDSYRQPVPLVSIEADSDTALTITAADGNTTVYAYGADAVFGTSRVVEETGLDASELVWAGYGIVAPEYDWNDYEGLDVAGKTVVVLVNDPGYATGNPDLFNGNKMTYYGRWTYKYEEAARQGAAGAIIVHQTEPASYGWNVVEGSWTGPQFHLASADGNAGNLALEGWVRHEVAQEIFTAAGKDLAAMTAAAAESSVTLEPLGVTATAPIRNTLEHAESFNIGAVIPGAERPDEMFIYMGHWDHLGVMPHEDGAEGDFIYNGAEDNASGTAALIEVARAFKALPTAPERTVGFLAVTAEESGLLGSKAYAANPAWPMNKTVAGINMDVLNFAGLVNDIEVVGFGGSEMEDILATEAKHYGRTLTPEATPEAGYYYRSDHFNFAKKGVPILYAKGGTVARDGDSQAIADYKAAYRAERYHGVADEIIDDWDIDAAVEDMRLFFRIGLNVADSDQWPAWNEGNEFKAIRDASLAE
ncbi:M28 family metallopeptidase [Marinihelvus fidelis]|uniref:M28 family metallopeptidase n=1 Tax=Marinihelvus fidelis TaxID=2613842 RepID=UPI001CD373D2|nr:M28 family metallopeptidase [Marinihelvus fidelis]